MKIAELLKEYQNDNNTKLVEYVVNDILEQDEPQTYIKDVMYGGCASGMVTSLIYYCDTDKFFIDYHDEIFDMVNEYKDQVGEFPLQDKELNSNILAWFGYEFVMQNIFNYLENCDISEDEEDII